MTSVVVVGASGGVGRASAATLARRGQRVLGLDRHGPVHDQGASHGETRIVRKAYFEGAGYVPLLLRSYELWQELGLLTATGGLFLGEPGSRVLEGSRATAVAHDLAHEVLTAAEVTARFPAMTPPGATLALYEADAGFVSPEQAVRAQLDRAASAGAELHHGEPVLSWAAGPAGVRATTAVGTYDAGALVLAPGKWAGELVDLPLPLRVEPRLMHWFDPPGGAEAFAPDRFPVWIWERADGTAPYGAPAAAGRAGGVKAAVHHSPVRAPADWTADQLGDLLAPLLPGLGRSLARSVECTYTLTPDEDFVVGCHPRHERVVLACGFSGHGFKFTPVLGEVLADLAVDGATAYDLALLSPQRFVEV
ncbi:MAG: N-methyl-L-tryptophan oxidase [Frankiales bacterium]|nr:N-methyl-L-tryptophan oxidase [Frankiales bacterium]